MSLKYIKGALSSCSIPYFQNHTLTGFQYTLVQSCCVQWPFSDLLKYLWTRYFEDSVVMETLLHEFHETCHSVTLSLLVNSHQRREQTQNCICFHLWCELTSKINVTEWQVSWNSWYFHFRYYWLTPKTDLKLSKCRNDHYI